MAFLKLLTKIEFRSWNVGLAFVLFVLFFIMIFEKLLFTMFVWEPAAAFNLSTTEFFFVFLSQFNLWCLVSYSVDQLFAAIEFLLIVLPVLISVAFFTLIERKAMSAMQRRRGPNVVGFFGLMQPLADALKLLLKETLVPIRSSKFLFLSAPCYTFILSFLSWPVIPVSPSYIFSNIELSLLYVFMISSLGIYGIILSGWSSNSKYAFLGGLRSTAQMISYEVNLGLVFVLLILCSNSLNLFEIIEQQRFVWFWQPLFPILIIFFISALAETNRAPFDLPEAEAELVSGYNIEYSSMGFALFFLGEYSNIILISSLMVCFFFGGYFFFNWRHELFFAVKLLFFIFSFVWVRATFPRYRYDQLMLLCWKCFLPFTIGFFFFCASFFLLLDFYFAVFVF